jgi:hypothetical protein
MMDRDTTWQDATIDADTGLIGPTQPEASTAPAEAEYDELEYGIASIFARLHAGSEDDTDADTAIDATFAEANTYQLLSELDRLWHRPER